MTEPGDESKEATRQRRRVIFVILCKNGNPHSAINPRTTLEDAEKVAKWLDSDGGTDCGPHEAASYGAL
jgi:hypothetical protein